MYSNLYKNLTNTLGNNKAKKAVLAYSIHQHALQYGDFTFASGIRSTNKFELELLPDGALDLVADIMTAFIGNDKPDAIFGVPNGGNPIAQRMAPKLGVPLIPTYKDTSRGKSLIRVHDESPIIDGNAYGFEDAITTAGSTITTIDAITRYAEDRGRLLVVPRVYAIMRRMEGNPDIRLKERGTDLSYIFTTREVLGWFMFLHERGLLELDSRWSSMW